MNKFEQLIEYVINDEDQKARELFHDIVVAKSREIYESMMAEEAAEDLDESAEEEEEEEEEELDESLEEDDPMAEIEQEEISMEGEDELGGDAADEFIDNVEASDDDEDMGGDDEPATKDDIMNLEDKLDELMAEFEAAMGGDAMGSDGDDMGPEEGGDAIAVDDTEEMMAEAITLKQVHPKTTTSEEGDGKAGPVAFNSGAAGMASKPVKATGTEAQGRPAPGTKDLIGKVGNSPAQGTQTLKPATKPHLGQASGVNNKSPLPSGTKG